MKTKEDLIFSVVALEGLLKVEGLYEDVLRIMDEYADQVKNCNIHDVSNQRELLTVFAVFMVKNMAHGDTPAWLVEQFYQKVGQ